MSTTSSTSAPASKSARNLGPKLQKGIGYAIGWLVVFPLFVGLLGGAIGWALGLDFGTWALACGAVALAFAVFAGIVIGGWKVVINLWPVLLVAGGIAFAVKKLFF